MHGSVCHIYGMPSHLSVGVRVRITVKVIATLTATVAFAYTGAITVASLAVAVEVTVTGMVTRLGYNNGQGSFTMTLRAGLQRQSCSQLQ